MAWRRGFSLSMLAWRIASAAANLAVAAKLRRNLNVNRWLF
jgi:hypothetical protein